MTTPEIPAPKTMARALCAALAERRIAISHSDALELVARQFGCENWNVLAARMPSDGRTVSPLATDKGAVPEGWFVHENGGHGLFRHDLLEGAGEDGGPAILLASRDGLSAVPTGAFLTVMQRFAATDFRDRRFSFRASLRVTDAQGRGRIWITACGAGRVNLAFDNLGMNESPLNQPDGPIAGTTGWERRSVTIDVPENTEYIQFGVQFGAGPGTFITCAPSFGLATAAEHPRALPAAPRNLDLRPASPA